MGLPKGRTNNEKGRPKGVSNKLTSELRKILTDLFSEEINKIPGILEKLEPKERLEILVKLLPFVLPKLENTNLDITDLKKINIKINGV